MSNTDIKHLVLLEIFSPDPYSDRDPTIPKEERDESYSRYKQSLEYTQNSRLVGIDWNYVFEPVSDEKWRKKLVDLLEHLDKDYTVAGGV